LGYLSAKPDVGGTPQACTSIVHSNISLQFYLSTIEQNFFPVTTQPATTPVTDTTQPATTTVADTTQPAATTVTDTTQPAATTVADAAQPATTTVTDTTQPAATTVRCP